MTMTPLQLEILLHYFSHADDFRGGDFNVPAVVEAVSGFLSAELLVDRDSRLSRSGESLYLIAPRGVVLVESLLTVKLPVKRWVMP